jgi:mannose-6-phosphate isomerase-like protein (cupin superfamily)
MLSGHSHATKEAVMDGEPTNRPAPLVRDTAGTEARRMLLGGPPETRGMRSGRILLAPGEEVGRHSTRGHEEALVILEGAGRLEIDGRESLPLAAGQVAYVPPETFHNVRADGPGPLRYIFIVAPAR